MTKFRVIFVFLALLTLAATSPVFGNQLPTQIVEDSKPAEGATETGLDAPATQEGAKPKKHEDPNRGRILPIPVFITEPAVGEGLGLVLAYFHRVKNKPEGKLIGSPGLDLRDTWGAGATTNGDWSFWCLYPQ